MSLKVLQHEAAMRMLARLQVIYGPNPHEFRPASLDEFPQLDHSFYERMRIWFESRGYRHLGDCENVTLGRVYPKSRTLIRRIVGTNDTVCVAIHSLRVDRGRYFRVRKTISLETEFDDGAFMITHNSTIDIGPLPSFDVLRLPHDVDPQLLLLTHSNRLAQRLNANLSLVATAVRTMEDAYSFQHRMHAIMAKFRRESGYLSREDLERMKGRPLTENEERFIEQIKSLNTSAN